MYETISSLGDAKKLEEKFKDVYTRIQDNKDFMLASGKDFNDKLKVYQTQFNTDLENVRGKLSTKCEEEKARVEDILVKTDDRMAKLETAIEEEKQERIRDWKQQLKEIDDNFNQVKQGFSDETKNRIAKKNNVLNAMAEGNTKVGILFRKW